MNVLILGSLPKTPEETAHYQTIIDVCAYLATTISSPIDTAIFHGNDQERYRRAFQKVADADLIIAEQSSPSTGQGMELREAALRDIPVIAIAKNGSNVSGLVKGAPNLHTLLYYADEAELATKLKETLQQFS